MTTTHRHRILYDSLHKRVYLISEFKIYLTNLHCCSCQGNSWTVPRRQGRKNINPSAQQVMINYTFNQDFIFFSHMHREATSTYCHTFSAGILSFLFLTMDDSTQQIRSHVMGQIQGILFELPPDVIVGTMRILGDTPNSILDPNNYLESIRPFAWEVQDGLHQYDRNNTTHFLAVTIYTGKHSYFVIDLNNPNYDYQTAHECKTPVPVYVLRLS